MFIREMRVYELIEVDQNGVRRLASGYFRVLKYFTHNHGLYPMGLYKYFFKCYPVFEIRNNINLTLKNAGEGGGSGKILVTNLACIPSFFIKTSQFFFP